jgi:hypothetical protein
MRHCKTIFMLILVMGALSYTTGCLQHGNTVKEPAIMPQQSQHPVSISMKDIDRLGVRPTWGDVNRLLNGMPFLMIFPLIEYPANEGGIYVFSFVPTNELSAVTEESKTTAKIPLIAVIKVASHEEFMRAEGYYVYPKNLYGKRFTGIYIAPPANSIAGEK